MSQPDSSHVDLECRIVVQAAFLVLALVALFKLSAALNSDNTAQPGQTDRLQVHSTMRAR